ncbi:unnamed protein product [Rotaria socialis]|uniref:Phosphodiesterase n=3 Tax=Rotaria TaxID=231623 RepID=A0A818T0W9_9BILA|nr:unnamed protein product [Rotaria socialis]CAF3678342.1 unnamed protein product [Rotaria socialis]
MSNPAQVLSRHRKTPLPPVVPPRQTLLSWTNSNQNGRPKTVPHRFGSCWWLVAKRFDDDDDDNYLNYMIEKNDDDNNDHYSSPPVKRIKLVRSSSDHQTLANNNSSSSNNNNNNKGSTKKSTRYRSSAKHGANSESSLPLVTADTVKHFLGDHPEFLDSYIQQNVNSNTIEQWMSKKPQKLSQIQQQRKSSASTHSPPPPPPRPSSSSSMPLVSAQKKTISSSTTKVPLSNNTDATTMSSLGPYSRPISSTTVKSISKLVELTDRRRLLHELTDEVNQHVTKAQILFELCRSIATTVAADGFNLYLVDESGISMRLFTSENDDEQAASVIPIPIGIGHCIAGYVAWSKETIRINNISKLDMQKYPDGIYIKDDQVTTVMAHPIVNTSGTLLGVVEFYRINSTIPFSDEDVEEILKCVNELFTQTYYELYHSMIRERRLNDFLLAVTKSIFQELVSMDTVMLKIMSYAKKLVNADRASLFMVDSRTKELYARIFDIGREENDILESSAVSDKDGHKSSLQDERACIRFPVDKGIAGYVATTGKTLNIVDAYSDNRFNRDIDQKTGYKTKTLLCMPIMIQGNVIGVVQMVNKKNGHFTKSDEESFETFAVYCGLALHHASLYDRIRRSEQKCKVALEVLSYHASCTDEEYERMKTYTLPDNIPNIDRFEYSPWDVVNDMKPLYVAYMFLDLANMDPLNANRFDSECLMRFILTVRKNYRNVPYHNWSHAFSVAHAIYTVIKQSKHHFSPNDCIALFVACLCHDLDHRGKTNAFMVKSASTLASIYSTSTMERHHFNQTVTILQTESHNIFKHFSSKEYRQMLDEIRHCILATDLALFFENRPKLERIVDNNAFDWNNKEHFRRLQSLSMTSADLCAMYKPWLIQQNIVSIIMDEFWEEGDEEKRQGIQPQSLMDRSLAHELPKNQVNFMKSICLPCYALIARVLPETKPMVIGAKSNLQRWQELTDEQQQLSRTNLAAISASTSTDDTSDSSRTPPANNTRQSSSS